MKLSTTFIARAFLKVFAYALLASCLTSVALADVIVIGAPDIDVDQSRHAFVFDGTSLFSLPFKDFYPSGINNDGDIVGTDGFANHGYLYRNGSLQEILIPGFRTIRPEGINDQGIVVGSMVPVSGGGFTGFLYDSHSSGFQTFGPSGTIALGTNNLGDVVGVDALSHPFLLSNGTFSSLPAIALAINDAGTMVGSFPASGQAYTMNKSGGMQTLPPVQNCATWSPTELNNAGQLSGTCFPVTNPTYKYRLGIVYELSSGSTTLLGNPGWSFDVRDINDKGQAVLNGTWQSIPEPSSVILLIIGLMTLIICRRTDRFRQRLQ